MKKLLFLMLGAFIALPAFASDGDTFTYQNIQYTVISENDKTVKTKEGQVFGLDYDASIPGNDVSGSLVLPETVENNGQKYTLVEIGDIGFANTDITDITLPNTLKTIGENAFGYCTKLTDIKIPDSVTSIDGRAFQHCRNLTSVTLPENLTEILYSTFAYCMSLKSITIPNSVTAIRDEAFGYCGLEEVKFGNSLKIIGYEAFYNCSNLGEIDLPESLTEIGIYAFYGTAATKVKIPDSVISSISFYLFGEGLTDLYIGNSVSEVIFESTKPNIKNIVIGSGVKRIRSDNYYHFPNLSSITIMNPEPPTFNFDYPGHPTNTVLYVPGEALDAYRAADHPFNIIAPVEGYKAEFIADDINISVNQEVTFSLDLNLTPADKYSGLQFDIQTPEGISIQSVKLNNDISDFTTYSQTLDNNTTRYIFQANGTNATSITDDVVAITIKADKDIQPGARSINITKAVGSTTYASEFAIDELAINVNVDFTVQSISLTPSWQYVKVREAIQFTATYEPSNAVNPQFIWEEKDNPTYGNIFIDPTGNTATVYGMSVGETKLIVKSALDESICSEATVEVIGLLKVDDAKHTIKETEKLALKATYYGSNLPYYGDSLPEEIYPYYAITPPSDLQWTSENPEYATIDASTGEVTGVAPGEAVINVASASKPYINATYTITIEPRIIGDANDNKFVNVADVVAIANDIAEYPVYNFCFVNADTDDSGSITTADLTKTVDIILKADNYQPYALKSPAINADYTDYLYIDNFNTSASGNDITFDVRLCNTMNYVALQATLILPEGMSVNRIDAGPRAAGHSLIYNVKSNNSTKIVLFSLNNEPFAQSDAALFSISASAHSRCNDNIVLDNILTSDAESNEYSLGFTGGLNDDFTSGSYAAELLGRIAVNAVSGGVEVLNADGADISVFNTLGETVAVIANASAYEKVSLTGGFYVVKAGNTVAKVAVK